MALSSVVTVPVQAGGLSLSVRIPRAEVFRLKEILVEAGYAAFERARPGRRVVVDVGANVGVFAIYAHCLDPQARIHCFEPAPDTLDLLRQNVADLPTVRVHDCALSNRSGRERLHLHAANGGQNSLVRTGAGFDASVPVAVEDAGAAFDRLGLRRVDVLKLDTEGSEVAILESLGPRLAHVDSVLVEYHSEADRRRIDALLPGFRVFGARAHALDCGVVKYVSNSLLKPGHRAIAAGGVGLLSP
ncbi:MAG: FkbM family methyltransferase [Proteobacteria bacterium]|nr:FkbM family methyltransferase [Pseudomonadota bacterium]